MKLLIVLISLIFVGCSESDADYSPEEVAAAQAIADRVPTNISKYVWQSKGGPKVGIKPLKAEFVNGNLIVQAAFCDGKCNSKDSFLNVNPILDIALMRIEDVSLFYSSSGEARAVNVQCVDGEKCVEDTHDPSLRNRKKSYKLFCKRGDSCSNLEVHFNTLIAIAKHEQESIPEPEQQDPPVLDLSGEWNGRFTYSDDRPPVRFTWILEDSNGSLQGRSIEENPSDPTGGTLTANLEGSLKRFAVELNKQYINGGLTDAVTYSGFASRHGTSFSGEWQLQGLDGEFNAYRIEDADAAASLITANLSEYMIETSNPYSHTKEDVNDEEEVTVRPRRVEFDNGKLLIYADLCDKEGQNCKYSESSPLQIMTLGSINRHYRLFYAGVTGEVRLECERACLAKLYTKDGERTTASSAALTCKDKDACRETDRLITALNAYTHRIPFTTSATASKNGNELVGVWELQNAALPGWVTEYRADGTYTFTNPQTVATGTYEAKNGLFINKSDVAAELDFEGEYQVINKNTLVLIGNKGRSVWKRKQ